MPTRVPVMGLSVKKIAKLPQGRHRDERGLYLQVRSEGNRSWIFRFKFGGRERLMGLGPLSLVGIEEARDKAFEARRLLAAGVDPLSERLKDKAVRAAKAAIPTFETVAGQFLDMHCRKWKSAKSGPQFLSSMRAYAYPVLGKLPVNQIERRHVLEVLEGNDLWTQKPETADRVRARIEAVLAFAAARDFRDEKNPATWKGNLSAILPPRSAVKVENHPSLPYAEMPAFMVRLRKREAVAAKALEFLILTAARTSEVTGAQWSEIDFDQKVWTVPEGRMKAGRPHRVPLVDEAITLLKSLDREEGNPFIFPGERKDGLSNMAMAQLVQKRMEIKDITIHGFRASFKTWTAEQTSFPKDLAEAALAHIVGDKVEAAYLRGDRLARRRELMKAWAGFIGKPVESANVIPLKSTPIG